MSSGTEIEMFISFTSADAEAARNYLGLVDGNLEQAVQLFFDSQESSGVIEPLEVDGAVLFEDVPNFPLSTDSLEGACPEPEFFADACDNFFTKESTANEFFTFAPSPRSKTPKRPASDRSTSPTPAYSSSDSVMQTRCRELTERLLSSAVQLRLPETAKVVQAKLTPPQVAKVFIENVPGVQTFLFREQEDAKSLEFIQYAYENGLDAFRSTVLHEHLLWLLRLTVHYGHECKPGAKKFLTEVAEAFTECQAVQARVVERVGLRIQGVADDFHGVLVRLVGEYKTLAIKMLALERIQEQHLSDDPNPTHYENRLTEDLGDDLGLNAEDIRRAQLDAHARSRFARLSEKERQAAVQRCLEIFDFGAMLSAFRSEVNKLSSESAPESLPRLFLDWASERIVRKELLMDEETCTRMQVDEPLSLAIFELVFLGRVDSPSNEIYRGIPMRELFFQDTNEAFADVSNTPLLPACSLDGASRKMIRRRNS